MRVSSWQSAEQWISPSVKNCPGSSPLMKRHRQASQRMALAK
jgi:hypothetical protein